MLCASCRYQAPLATLSNKEHLGRYEDLIEAAIDVDHIPDEFLIAPHYDPRLEVCQRRHSHDGGVNSRIYSSVFGVTVVLK